VVDMIHRMPDCRLNDLVFIKTGVARREVANRMERQRSRRCTATWLVPAPRRIQHTVTNTKHISYSRVEKRIRYIRSCPLCTTKSIVLGSTLSPSLPTLSLPTSVWHARALIFSIHPLPARRRRAQKTSFLPRRTPQSHTQCSTQAQEGRGCNTHGTACTTHRTCTTQYRACNTLSPTSQLITGLKCSSSVVVRRYRYDASYTRCEARSRQAHGYMCVTNSHHRVNMPID